jgi:NAD(P)H-dependent FMN reductase
MLVPMFHQDSEKPLPEAVFQFRTQRAQADAWLIVTSEYSSSLSGALKNAAVRATTFSPAMGSAIPLVKLDRSGGI